MTTASGATLSTRGHYRPGDLAVLVVLALSTSGILVRPWVLLVGAVVALVVVVARKHR